MKVTIDTKEDNPEDIRKVMEILAHVLQKKDVPSSAVDTTNMMQMFDAPQNNTEEQCPQQTRDVPNTPPDFTSFLNLAQQNKEEPRDDEPKVQFF